MTLVNLIRKREPATPANANPAKAANDGKGVREPLARLATLALATSRGPEVDPNAAANQPEPVDRQELTWRVAVIHRTQGDSEQVVAQCVQDALARPEAALECYRALWERRGSKQGAKHGD